MKSINKNRCCSVSRTLWIVPGNPIEMKNPSWETFLDSVVLGVASKLGVDQTRKGANAILVSLLLQQSGGETQYEQISDPNESAFGFLDIVLPTEHKGSFAAGTGNTTEFDRLGLKYLTGHERFVANKLQEASNAGYCSFYFANATYTSEGNANEIESSNLVFSYITDADGNELFRGLMKTVNEKVSFENKGFEEVYADEQTVDFCGNTIRKNPSKCHIDIALYSKTIFLFLEKDLDQRFLIRIIREFCVNFPGSVKDQLSQAFIEEFCVKVPWRPRSVDSDFVENVFEAVVLLDDKSLFRRILPAGIFNGHCTRAIRTMSKQYGQSWLRDCLTSELSMTENFTLRCDMIKSVVLIDDFVGLYQPLNGALVINTLP
ncbi:hypothetical protein B0J14DRAFT_631956 [Halenospora varia]|nr:hypothetical protein B0J14DRAFT_631956 [Halenospora varia]